MTMYFRSLFPSACPIGHNGWIEIGCPICRLYFFRDRTYIYDNVHLISIPKCFYDRILYIRIEIGCPICKVDFFRDRIDFHEYVFLSLLPRACSIGPNMAYRDRISDLYSIFLHRRMSTQSINIISHVVSKHIYTVQTWKYNISMSEM